jgi:hypothetical protein
MSYFRFNPDGSGRRGLVVVICALAGAAMA